MSDKSLRSDKIDILKFLSKTHRDLHEKRIKRELHVVITSLTFYAACVAFKINTTIPDCSLFGFISCFAFTILAIYVFLYMESSGLSNNINQKVAEEAEKRLSGLSECLDDINIIKKEVMAENRFDKRCPYKTIKKIACLLGVEKEFESNYQDTIICRLLLNISKMLGIETKEKEKNGGHPSVNRWLWQASVVILGAFIANMLISYFWGILFDLLIILIIVVNWYQKSDGTVKKFTIEYEQENDGRWLAEVVELNGVKVYGQTRQETLAQAFASALRVLDERLEQDEMLAEPINILIRPQSVAGKRSASRL